MISKLRQIFAVRLCGIVAPDTSGVSLVAIMEALSQLQDLPDALFTAANATAIAPKCTALPDAEEIRELLLDLPTRPPRLSVVKPGLRPVPDWLIRRILDNVSWQPGEMLRGWFEHRGIDLDAILAEHRHA